MHTLRKGEPFHLQVFPVQGNVANGKTKLGSKQRLVRAMSFISTQIERLSAEMGLQPL